MRPPGRTDAIPPQALILIGIASVQFGAAFADTLFAKAGPAGVVLMRLAFASAVLLALTRPRLRGRTRRDLLAAVGFGLVLACMNWSFYESLDRLPLGPAATVEFIGPLGVAIAGSRKMLDLLWVALAGGGVALLAFGGSHQSLDLVGLLLAALAGAFWAAYILLSQRVGSGFAGLDGLAIALTLATLVMLPAGVADGGSALLRPDVLLGGLGVAVLSSLIPYSLELIALRRLSAAGFGLLMSLEPAFAALAGMLVLSQRPQLRTVAAIVMVVVASAGTTLEANRSATGRAGRSRGPEATGEAGDSEPDAGAAPLDGPPGEASGGPALSGPAPTSQPPPLG
ncbi:MAG TPA: EamA family transporter [Jatrophihabitans sp.]|uniref:EamA family transporter n=1 Tax=Jatrophihabitans sp. TaxID=1932789 RepID=UPI002EE78ADA